VDWRHDPVEVLREQRGTAQPRSVQGNIDPQWLLLEASQLETRLREYFSRLLAAPASLRSGWVCGLGHGVLQTTPESNVRLALTVQREMFA
jgi:uroporphyrinogen decarboxylase